MKKIERTRRYRSTTDRELRAVNGGGRFAERCAADDESTLMRPETPDMWDMIEGAIDKMNELAEGGGSAA